MPSLFCTSPLKRKATLRLLHNAYRLIDKFAESPMKHLHINMETANHQCLFRANVKRNRGRYGQASLQWEQVIPARYNSGMWSNSGISRRSKVIEIGYRIDVEELVEQARINEPRKRRF